MQTYKVWLPQRSAFSDEYDDWIQRSYTSRRHEGLYDATERDYEDDLLPSIPNGSHLDDFSIDNTDEIQLD